MSKNMALVMTKPRRTFKWKTRLKCSKVDCSDGYTNVGIQKPIELYTLGKLYGM